MTTATLTLGPTYHTNGSIRVIVICKWPAPPEDFFFVVGVHDSRIYRAHYSQLTDYKVEKES